MFTPPTEDLFKILQSHLREKCEIAKEGARIIVAHKLFKCFVSRAYDIKSKQFILSAHVLRFADGQIHYWNVDSVDNETAVLEQIIQDLSIGI